MSEQSKERDEQVLAVLKSAGVKTMTPSEIARKINKPWCMYGRFPSSAPVSAVLKRIGAVKLARGSWIKPATERQKQEDSMKK